MNGEISKIYEDAMRFEMKYKWKKRNRVAYYYDGDDTAITCIITEIASWKRSL